MDIIFSANNNEEVLVLPIIPSNLPAITQSCNNEIFETTSGDINLIGNKGLKNMTLECWLPVNKNYRFIRPEASSDGWEYIRFWQKWTDKKVPVRIVITDDLNEILNMAVTIESIEYSINKRKDIDYVLELQEYVFVKVG